MSATINLMKDNADFKIPVYLIQGSGRSLRSGTSNTMKPIQIGVVMGSSSDWDTMQHAVQILEQFGIEHGGPR